MQTATAINPTTFKVSQEQLKAMKEHVEDYLCYDIEAEGFDGQRSRSFLISYDDGHLWVDGEVEVTTHWSHNRCWWEDNTAPHELDEFKVIGCELTCLMYADDDGEDTTFVKGDPMYDQVVEAICSIKY